MLENFENWLRETENKKEQTAYNYARAINRISKHYTETRNEALNLYKIKDASKLRDIVNLYKQNGIYSEYGNQGNGTNRAALNAFYRFYDSITELQNIEDIITIDTDDEIKELGYTQNFSYEKDLKNSILYQIPELFPNYKVFGTDNEGVEYPIGGRRIDILLEHNETGDLLAVELKAGIAKFIVFGQIAMYIGLLSEKFRNKEIKGCIIAGEIDDSLKFANLTTNKIELLSYNMKLELSKV